MHVQWYTEKKSEQSYVIYNQNDKKLGCDGQKWNFSDLGYKIGVHWILDQQL